MIFFRNLTTNGFSDCLNEMAVMRMHVEYTQTTVVMRSDVLVDIITYFTLIFLGALLGALGP